MKKVLVVFTSTSFPPHIQEFAIDMIKERAGVLKETTATVFIAHQKFL